MKRPTRSRKRTIISYAQQCKGLATRIQKRAQRLTGGKPWISLKNKKALNTYYFMEGVAKALLDIAELGDNSTFLKASGYGPQLTDYETWISCVKSIIAIARDVLANKPASAYKRVEKLLNTLESVEGRLIPKVGTAGGFRPLGMPNHIGKLIEAIVQPLLNHLAKQMEGGYGFAYGDSPEIAFQKAVHIAERPGGARERGCYAVMFDQSNAFNQASVEAKEGVMSHVGCTNPTLRAILERVAFSTEYKYLGESNVLIHDVKVGEVARVSPKGMSFQKKPGKWVSLENELGTAQGMRTSPLIFRIAQALVIDRVQKRLVEMGLPQIEHSFYADDAILFIEPNCVEQTMQVIKEEYGKSGFIVNEDKSEAVKLTPTSGGYYMLGYDVQNRGGAITAGPHKDHILGRMGKNKDGYKWFRQRVERYKVTNPVTKKEEDESPEAYWRRFAREGRWCDLEAKFKLWQIDNLRVDIKNGEIQRGYIQQGGEPVPKLGYLNHPELGEVQRSEANEYIEYHGYSKDEFTQAYHVDHSNRLQPLLDIWNEWPHIRGEYWDKEEKRTKEWGTTMMWLPEGKEKGQEVPVCWGYNLPVKLGSLLYYMRIGATKVDLEFVRDNFRGTDPKLGEGATVQELLDNPTMKMTLSEYRDYQNPESKDGRLLRTLVEGRKQTPLIKAPRLLFKKDGVLHVVIGGKETKEMTDYISQKWGEVEWYKTVKSNGNLKLVKGIPGYLSRQTG